MDNKKDKHPNDKIREGRGDDHIHREKKDSNRKSYPQPSKQDEQFKNQPEFLNNEPNRTDKDE